MERKSSQTLIETIVATAIVIIALVGILSLALSTLSLGGQTTEWVQAITLAREGVEVCQAVRSTNWFNEGQTWSFGLDNGVYVFDYGDTDFDTAANGNIDSCLNCKLCFDPTTKIYSHADDSGNCTVGLTKTLFRRIVTIATGDDLGTNCSANCEKVATVLVKWTEKDRPHQVTLEKKFTDWR
ncbi:MAG: hypothetical protein PHV78_00515 [Patescibacteria group bacterium]|nr:hypothetical protein [Patescibacteria group bacterium]MDD5121345.1 hypothetical protein [Patescibacteria group bacterium]MDD5395736.1 hypothetical protein [Patescibacteria group bacterium]